MENGSTNTSARTFVWPRHPTRVGRRRKGNPQKVGTWHVTSLQLMTTREQQYFDRPPAHRYWRYQTPSPGAYRASNGDHRTPVSYTHLRAHETPEHLVCRLLLEKKK